MRLRGLLIAIGVALALTACGRQEPSGLAPAKAPAPATTPAVKSAGDDAGQDSGGRREAVNDDPAQ